MSRPIVVISTSNEPRPLSASAPGASDTRRPAPVPQRRAPAEAYNAAASKKSVHFAERIADFRSPERSITSSSASTFSPEAAPTPAPATQRLASEHKSARAAHEEPQGWARPGRQLRPHLLPLEILAASPARRPVPPSSAATGGAGAGAGASSAAAKVGAPASLRGSLDPFEAQHYREMLDHATIPGLEAVAPHAGPHSVAHSAAQSAAHPHGGMQARILHAPLRGTVRALAFTEGRLGAAAAVAPAPPPAQPPATACAPVPAAASTGPHYMQDKAASARPRPVSATPVSASPAPARPPSAPAAPAPAVRGGRQRDVDAVAAVAAALDAPSEAAGIALELADAEAALAQLGEPAGAASRLAPSSCAGVQAAHHRLGRDALLSLLRRVRAASREEAAGIVRMRDELLVLARDLHGVYESGLGVAQGEKGEHGEGSAGESDAGEASSSGHAFLRSASAAAAPSPTLIQAAAWDTVPGRRALVERVRSLIDDLRRRAVVGEARKSGALQGQAEEVGRLQGKLLVSHPFFKEDPGQLRQLWDDVVAERAAKERQEREQGTEKGGKAADNDAEGAHEEERQSREPADPLSRIFSRAEGEGLGASGRAARLTREEVDLEAAVAAVVDLRAAAPFLGSMPVGEAIDRREEARRLAAGGLPRLDGSAQSAAAAVAKARALSTMPPPNALTAAVLADDRLRALLGEVAELQAERRAMRETHEVMLPRAVAEAARRRGMLRDALAAELRAEEARLREAEAAVMRAGEASIAAEVHEVASKGARTCVELAAADQRRVEDAREHIASSGRVPGECMAALHVELMALIRRNAEISEAHAARVRAHADAEARLERLEAARDELDFQLARAEEQRQGVRAGDAEVAAAEEVVRQALWQQTVARAMIADKRKEIECLRAVMEVSLREVQTQRQQLQASVERRANTLGAGPVPAARASSSSAAAAAAVQAAAGEDAGPAGDHGEAEELWASAMRASAAAAAYGASPDQYPPVYAWGAPLPPYVFPGLSPAPGHLHPQAHYGAHPTSSADAHPAASADSAAGGAGGGAADLSAAHDAYRDDGFEASTVSAADLYSAAPALGSSTGSARGSSHSHPHTLSPQTHQGGEGEGGASARGGNGSGGGGAAMQPLPQGTGAGSRWYAVPGSGAGKPLFRPTATSPAAGGARPSAASGSTSTSSASLSTSLSSDPSADHPSWVAGLRSHGRTDSARGSGGGAPTGPVSKDLSLSESYSIAFDQSAAAAPVPVPSSGRRDSRGAVAAHPTTSPRGVDRSRSSGPLGRRQSGGAAAADASFGSASSSAQSPPRSARVVQQSPVHSSQQRPPAGEREEGDDPYASEVYDHLDPVAADEYEFELSGA